MVRHMRINSDNKIKNKNLKEAGSQKSSKMKCSNNLSSVKVPFFLGHSSDVRVVTECQFHSPMADFLIHWADLHR